MKRTKRCVLSLLVVGGLLAGCGSRERAVERLPTPVTVQAVEAYAGAPGLRYSANIEPYAQVELAFKVEGYIRELRQVRGVDGRLRSVQGGDWVERGTVLARVRESNYAARLEQARGQLAEAEQARDSAVSQLAEARAALERARSGLTAAQAAFEKAGLDMKRARSLYEAQSLTKVDYDQAKARFDETGARVDGARAEVAAAEARVETAQSQIGVADGRIAAARAGVVEGEIQLGDTALTVPADGLILKRNVEAGDFAQPGKVGFTLGDVSAVKVVYGVPDVILPNLTLGSLQTITAEGTPGAEFRGRITRVSPSADPKSRTFDVEVTVPNSGYRLKVGQIASLRLGAARPAASVPVVPLGAIVRPKDDPTGYAVVIVEEQGGLLVARLRSVGLGETYGNVVGVVQGVKVGDRVVVTGATLLRDGEPVRLVP